MSQVQAIKEKSEALEAIYRLARECAKELEDVDGGSLSHWYMMQVRDIAGATLDDDSIERIRALPSLRVTKSVPLHQMATVLRAGAQSSR